MLNNKLIYISAVSILFIHLSCATKKIINPITGRNDTSKIDSLNKLLIGERYKTSILTFEYIKLKEEFLEHLKNDSLIANNVGDDNVIDNTLPSFFNPPPQASAKYTFNAIEISKFKTYGEIDGWLANLLNNAGYVGKFNYFLFNNGFVIATEIEQINRDATTKPSDERWSAIRINLTRKDWSLTDYVNTLFKSQPGYYRSIVFIISPSIYQFSANDYGKDLFAKYLSQGSIGLPSQLTNTVVPKDIKVTALIYEFEKPENAHEAILVTDGLTGLEHLKKASIIKR